MAHTTTPRPPLDIGATRLTGIRPGLQQRLIDFLGLEGDAVITTSGVDERILNWAGTDFRSVGYIPELPSPLSKKVSDSCSVNYWGVTSECIDGEWQITRSPLAGADRKDLAEFQWPEPRINEDHLRNLEEQARTLYKQKKYVIVAGHPIYGMLELGCWMCGYNDFMLKLAMDPDFIRDFFDRVVDIQLEVSRQYYTVLGPYIHLTTSGDDFGTQSGPFMSPAMFEELVAPAFSRRIQLTKKIGDCYYWHHSCGSIAKLLPHIIECGVDILNPVQTSAEGMDPQRLKDEFGDRIVFWGAVDVQQFLPRAQPDQIQMEIQSLVRILGKDGGYVMAPAHEMQDDIPPENVVAWVEAFRDEGE